MVEPLNGVRLHRRDRNNNDALTLQELFQDCDYPQIKGYQIQDEANNKILVYAIELPKSRKNQNLIKRIDLREFNSLPNRLAFTRIIDTSSRLEEKLTKEQARDLLARDFYPMSEPTTYLNPNIQAEDLRDLPFISIDCDPVRDANGDALYGDYDDIFYIKNDGSQLDCYIGFADITPYFNLDKNDPILRNAMRFGFTLYSGHNTLPMIGAETERKTSLLEGKDRFAWVLNFKLGLDGQVDQKKANFFRAKVRNRVQLGFSNQSGLMTYPEQANDLANFRIAATIIQNINNPELLKKFLYQKVDFEEHNSSLDGLVRDMMIFARHTLGLIAVEKDIPVINRIQNRPPDINLDDWAKQIKNVGAICNTSHLSSLKKIVQLIANLANSKESRQTNLAATMFSQLSGQAIYSDNPRIHSDLGLEPYQDIKGLRKLVGLVNQAIYHIYLDPKSASGHNLELVKKIIPIANKLKRNNDISNTDFAVLQSIIHR